MYEANQHFSNYFTSCKILNLPKKTFLKMAEKAAGFDPMGAIQESIFAIYSHLHTCDPEKNQKEFSFSSILLWYCDALYKYGKKM